MSPLFGTDGIRGTYGSDLTTDVAAAVATAIAQACRDGVLGPRAAHPRVVIGRDTRVSGPQLEAAMSDAFTGAGADALLVGVVPTPAVAFLTSSLGADAGVIISASHNPPQDNGIKIFSPGGWKLSMEAERAIEDLVGKRASSSGGVIETLPEAAESYIEHVVGGARLDGVRLVVDCANGAASTVAPEALRRAGADVALIHADADGARINDGCGALHPEVVTTQSRERNLIGVTFDGDADRVLFGDERGNTVDGDATLAILASRMRAEGRLKRDGIVVTVMANQALRGWSAAEGIELVETPVGDRHVLEMMRARDLVLGGEQSGHVIVGDRTTTGDGLLTAIEVLQVVAEHGGRLSDVVPFRPMPQVLLNVRTNGGRVHESDALRTAIEYAQRQLGPDGRILVRRSGTEPVVRVMVEAPDQALAAKVAGVVAAAVERDAKGA